MSEVVVAAVFVFGLGIWAGWMATLFFPAIVRKRRTLGRVVAGPTITYVFDNLDYTVKQDQKGSGEVQLSGRHYTGAFHDAPEHAHVSITIGAQTEIADGLHTIYRAKAMQCILQPMPKGSDIVEGGSVAVAPQEAAP